MRTKEEIENMIQELTSEAESWNKRQREYNWSAKERDEGSSTYGWFQEKESEALRKISLLNWVLQ